MPQQAEWNFIFLIYADLTTDAKKPGTDSWKFELLKQTILNLPIPDNCNIFIIRNHITLTQDRPLRIVTDNFFCERISQGILSSLFSGETVSIMDQKPGIIGKYLGKIREQFSSNKTALFTWDHGSVFGINKIEKRTPQNDVIDSSIDETDIFPEFNFHINPLLLRPVNGLEKDDSVERLIRGIKKPDKFLSRFIGSGDKKELLKDDTLEPEVNMLTNEMLAKALVIGGFDENKKIDVACMMNCCMQNLHCQYALKGSVNFLVAPQTWIYFPGYDYRFIFERIVREKPSVVDGEGLALLIIESCKQDSIKPKPLVVEIHSEGIFSVNLLLITEIVDQIEKNIAEDILKLKDVKYKTCLFNACQYSYIQFENLSFLKYRLIDVFEYFNKRIENNACMYNNQVISDTCSVFNDIKKSIPGFIGKNVKKVAKNNISSLAISLPDYLSYSNPSELFIQLFYKPSKYQSDLVKKLKLNTFLDSVYSR